VFLFNELYYGGIMAISKNALLLQRNFATEGEVVKPGFLNAVNTVC
jgi:hypothetical protein